MAFDDDTAQACPKNTFIPILEKMKITIIYDDYLVNFFFKNVTFVYIYK